MGVWRCLADTNGSSERLLLVLVAQLPAGGGCVLAPGESDAHGEPLGLEGPPEGKHCVPAGPSEVCVVHSVPGDQVDVRAAQAEPAQLICELLSLR